MCLATPAFAGIFSVTPVRIYMKPSDKAVAVTITNEGEDDMVMQADVYSWKQKPDGTDDLVLTEDMLVSPPIIKVPAKSHQVVRLARLVPPQPAQQMTYRLIVREIPEARPPKDKVVQLQVALAFSMPVFITPPAAKNKLDCAMERTATHAANAVCENTGNAYAQVLDFALTSEAGGKKLAGRTQPAYILPTIKRSFELKADAGRIPAGKAKLTVTLDDGSKQAFDVMLAE
jgi:fimbrial chaperone protein